MSQRAAERVSLTDQVPCPVCDAGVGERCRAWFRWWPHRLRVADAEYLASREAS